jgi:hypothetical protein
MLQLLVEKIGEYIKRYHRRMIRTDNIITDGEHHSQWPSRQQSSMQQRMAQHALKLLGLRSSLSFQKTALTSTSGHHLRAKIFRSLCICTVVPW